MFTIKKPFKIISSVIAIPIFVLFSFFISFGSASERIETSFADKVLIEAEEYVDRPSFIVVVENNDAQKLKEIFNGKKTWYDTPSCPCRGVNIIFKSENKEIVLFPAGDGCGTVRFGKYNYLYLSEDKNKLLGKMLVKYGVTYPFGI